ncbi:hypothetical protein [Pelagibacterium sediminicola]|uniref:hypothetical protein n=1 Tax=Pelagibacterium sediminicola TaxID=2248761 RepID=UPI000E311A15|nr:hypothetical protein [Pelagibacterium sediminicola]
MSKFVTVHQFDEIIVGDIKYRVNQAFRLGGTPIAEIDVMTRGEGVWLTGDFVVVEVPASRRMKLETLIKRVNDELNSEDLEEAYY